jgi:hypothetical protein
MNRNLKYFKIANELNKDFHNQLIERKLHFRGNENSFSLISVAKETAEKGVPNLKEKEDAIKLLKNEIVLSEPKRNTPEKELQAWIILYSMRNNGVLPFSDNLKLITTELVFKNKKEYKLSKPKRDIRNDILAIDDKNNLCVIELKYTRDNEVKRQTLEFEKVVKYENEFFYQLVKLYTDKEWNGSIRKISVWPKAEGKTRKKEYIEVEEINYSTNEEKTIYTFE